MVAFPRKRLSALVSSLASVLLLGSTGVGAAQAEGPNVQLKASIPFTTSGFDISWVQQSTGRYFLGDRGNVAVDWFDASTTDPSSFFVRFQAQGAFAGNGIAACKSASPDPHGCGGPNGVVTDDQSRVWAGDSPTATDSQSSVKVINTTTPYTYTTINTGGV